MTVGRRLRWIGSRGVTVVEYSLIVSLFVFGSIGAIKQLNTRSGTYYTGASNDIGDLPQLNIDTSDEDTIPPASSSTSSTSTTSTTSTTTSTTSTTTTTTTTTTIPTTTSTTVPLRSTINQITDLSSGQSSSWTASVRVKITNNRTGAAINNAAVTIRLTGKTGVTLDRNCTTDSTGRCLVTYSGVPYSENPGTGRVIAVSSSPVWDTVQASVVISP